MSRGKENKPHIGILGQRNKGKSSLINALAGQDIAIVSDVAGTTTDPVKKSIEIHGIGPLILIDTAGIDDTGELGSKRVGKTRQMIRTIDLAIIVIDNNEFGENEKTIIQELNKNDVPFFLVHNKSDLHPLSKEISESIAENTGTEIIDFSAISADNVPDIIALIKKYLPESAFRRNTIVGDLISYGDVVLLVTPIDAEAPEGRLILPQVQVIRDILDNDGIAIVLKERELDAYIRKMEPEPALVITDSQAFLKVDASVPSHIPMTSFSILLARQKGTFEDYINGTRHISKLKDGDKVLLLESCTHHVSCDDIGRVKIPRWLSNFTGKKLEYETIAGLGGIESSLEDYSLIIQCGGCVITQKQLQNRVRPAIKKSIPVTNYGMAIAYVQGVFERSVQPFLVNSTDVSDYL